MCCVSIESELLYNKIVENLHDYLHKVMSIVFVGDEDEWNGAKRLNMLMSRYKVDVNRYMRWNVILRKLDHPAFLPDVETAEDHVKLKKKLEDVQRQLFRDVLLADDGYSAALDRKAGSDVAKARPQEDDPDADAAPGIRNVMLTGRPVESQLMIMHALREKLKAAKEHAKNDDDGDEDDDKEVSVSDLCGEKIHTLPGMVKDFENIPYLMTHAFPWLFPLGVTERHLGGLRKLPLKKRKQLFQFYDRRFQETP